MSPVSPARRLRKGYREYSKDAAQPRRRRACPTRRGPDQSHASAIGVVVDLPGRAQDGVNVLCVKKSGAP